MTFLLSDAIDAKALKAKIFEELVPIPESDIETRFVESLDECNEPYQLGDLEFSASDILKSCDPVAYRCALSDFISAEEGETLIEIDGVYFDAHEVERLASDLELEADGK